MNLFDDDTKAYVTFKYSAYGQTHEFNAEFDDSVEWSDILDPIVRTLESAYGYSFRLNEKLGIYHEGKQDESE